MSDKDTILALADRYEAAAAEIERLRAAIVTAKREALEEALCAILHCSTVPHAFRVIRALQEPKQ